MQELPPQELPPQPRPTPAQPMLVRAPAGVRVPARVTPRAAVVPGQHARMFRSRNGSVLAGVASGLAGHLGVRVLWVRLTFALLCLVGGAGVLAYGLLWMFVPQSDTDEDVPALPKERTQAFGVAALGIGLTLVSSTVSGFISGWVIVPIAVILLGAVLVWREADESQRRRFRGPVGAVLGGGGWPAGVRIVAGVGLVITGITVVALRSGTVGQVQYALLAVLATLVGVAVLTVPFWVRLVRDLREERRARIRTEERADIAAHLHDSVLQTLALIQKQADSPREVARLARGQERQLRTWLYGAAGHGAKTGESSGTRLSEALADAAGEVEDTFAVSVQHVVVGDADMTERLIPIVQAAREAMVNAAKHAEVAEVSLYAEVEPGVVSVFVRDRGKGFDPAAVPADRHGLAHSIRGRMERNGGSCAVRSAPGQGTEVRLRMPIAGNEGESA